MDNIRPPDPVKKERLIGLNDPIDSDLDIWIPPNFLHEFTYIDNPIMDPMDDPYGGDRDIDHHSLWEKTIQDSIEEYEALEKKEIESIYQESFLIEKSNRLKKVEPILQKLKRIMGYDSVIKQIYEIIQPPLDSYCNQYCIHSEMDTDTYHFIFKHIRNIRISSEEMHFLESFFLSV